MAMRSAIRARTSRLKASRSAISSRVIFRWSFFLFFPIVLVLVVQPAPDLIGSFGHNRGPVLGPLSEVIVHVDDMAREVAFYRDVLGLEVDIESDDWTTFATGMCTLALHGGGRIGTHNVRVNFGVDDLDAVRAALRERGVETTEVRQPVPGILVADVRDPEGNVISLEERAVT
jgi:lactoylglutathione lyase